MLKQGSGAIVNTASVAGLIGFAMGFSAYVAAKHGVNGLTKTAALEYAKVGIRVNAVCPGAIRTPMFERGVRDNPGMKKKQVVAVEPIGRMAATGRGGRSGGVVVFRRGVLCDRVTHGRRWRLGSAVVRNRRGRHEREMNTFSHYQTTIEAIPGHAKRNSSVVRRRGHVY